MELPPMSCFSYVTANLSQRELGSPIERNASMTRITRQVPRTSDLKLWIQNGKCCVRITKINMLMKCNRSVMIVKKCKRNQKPKMKI